MGVVGVRGDTMTSLKDLQEILANTKPPKQLLHYFPNGKVTPLYMFEAVTKITGNYHGGPYSYEEKFAISQAKRAADLDGRQPRSDEVFRWEYQIYFPHTSQQNQEHFYRQQLHGGGARLPEDERDHPRPQHLRQGERAGHGQSEPFSISK